MAEYDDTNKGAAFAPFDDMELLLQGNVDNGGRSTKLAVIRRTSREGKEIMEVYEKIGAIFPNDNDKEGAPDYTGSIYKTDDKQSTTLLYSINNKTYRLRSFLRGRDEGCDCIVSFVVHTRAFIHFVT